MKATFSKTLFSQIQASRQIAPGVAARQLQRQFDALCLAAREGGGRWAQLHVGQAHVHQALRERASSPWCNGEQECVKPLDWTWDVLQ